MIRLFQSWLFVPGDSEKMLAKARGVTADVVILDLEDAVAPDQKDRARELVAHSVRAGDVAAATFVRINPLEDGPGRADLTEVVAPGLHGIMLPKTQSVSQLEALSHALDEAEAAAGIEIGAISVAALIETPQGVLNAAALARGPRVSALCLGGEDFSLALGARRTSEGHELDFARATLVTAAAAAGVQVVDTVWTDIRDVEGLDAECRRTRDLGFTGKLAIHPGQLDSIREAFAPSADELANAHRIVAAFQASPGGVVTVEGRMIDAPVVKRAQRLLASAPPLSEVPVIERTP